MKEVKFDNVNRISRNAENLYLIQGIDDNKPAWYYLSVEKLKLPLFLRECKENRGKIRLLKYGKVIEYGWGKDPAKSR